MAVDMFLKIGTVKGESVADSHKGEIEVLSWHWGATQTGTTHSGTGGGAGKGNFQDISITKYLDSSSPVLMDHLAKGKHIPQATLCCQKVGNGGKSLVFFLLKMEDLIVSSLQTGGAGHDERVTETLALNFARYEMEYRPQKADGSSEAPVTTKFDISKNA